MKQCKWCGTAIQGSYGYEIRGGKENKVLAEICGDCYAKLSHGAIYFSKLKTQNNLKS